VGQFAKGPGLSVEDLMAVAGETQRILEGAQRLEQTSREQERTARALREANDKLTRLAQQKEAFLSRVSHELRTPMTSIRAFSSLLAEDGLRPEEARRFAGILDAEAARMTRLLDDILHLSVLREGEVTLERREGMLRDVVDRAVLSSGATGGGLRILRDPGAEAIALSTDLDRLAPGLHQPRLQRAEVLRRGGPRAAHPGAGAGRRGGGGLRRQRLGIPVPEREVIFESFARLSGRRAEGEAGGAGLGLAICREVAERLGGSIAYLPGRGARRSASWSPASSPTGPPRRPSEPLTARNRFPLASPGRPRGNHAGRRGPPSPPSQGAAAAHAGAGHPAGRDPRGRGGAGPAPRRPSIQEEEGELDDLLGRLEGGLMLLALRQGGQASGMIALDAEGRAAAIEAQALGRIAPAAPDAREPTAADAALARPFLAALLREAEGALAGTPLDGWLAAPEVAERVAPREAPLLLATGATARCG
jgi:hypothetical protein